MHPGTSHPEARRRRWCRMSEAFFWGLVGGSSLVLGALVVFVHGPAKRSLGLIMGFGAGVLLSAVSFELIDEALTVSAGEGATVLGFFSGALVFYLGDSAIARIGKKGEEKRGHRGCRSSWARFSTEFPNRRSSG